METANANDDGGGGDDDDDGYGIRADFCRQHFLQVIYKS